MEIADQLEYLTIDTVAWSKGYERPRMDPDQRRIRHCITQRNFIARRRSLLDQLNQEMRRYKLVLKWIEAQEEIARLQLANAALSLDLALLKGVSIPGDEFIHTYEGAVSPTSPF